MYFAALLDPSLIFASTDQLYGYIIIALQGIFNKYMNRHTNNKREKFVQSLSS